MANKNQVSFFMVSTLSSLFPLLKSERMEGNKGRGPAVFLAGLEMENILLEHLPYFHSKYYN